MSSLPPFKKNYNLRKSFGFALEGLWFCIKWERNFRIHLLAATLVMYLSHRYYTLSPGERGLLFLATGFVLATEMLNTSIERIIDILSPDYNSLAKIVKDVAAGAVFISAIGAVGVGIVLLGNTTILQLILKDMVKEFYLWIPLLFLSLLLIFLPEYIQKTKAATREKR